MDKLTAKTRLLEILQNNTKVCGVLIKVSRSGMSRNIKLLVINDGHIMNIDYYVNMLLGKKYSDKGGVNVRGCGMDMLFHLVDLISNELGVNLRYEWL